MTILIISPHPDDESIGCGGTIVGHIAQGDRVDVIFLTSGEKGGHGKAEAETAKIREEEAKQAAIILGVSGIDYWRQPDGNLTLTAELVERLKNKIMQTEVTTVYVTHEQEEHPDHKQAALLVKKAVEALPEKILKPLVWGYEVWTPIQQLDCIVDISAHIETKRKAIQAHKSQCEVLQFDEAIIGLNRYRGEMHSWPGVNYAEVFKKFTI